MKNLLDKYGVPGFAAGGFTDAQVAAYIRDNNLSPAQAAQAAAAFGVSSSQLASAQNLLSSGAPSVQQASQTYAAQVADRPDLVEQNLAAYNPATGAGWLAQAPAPAPAPPAPPAPVPGSAQYVENVKNWFAERPDATAADIQDAVQRYGLNPADVRSAMEQAGLSQAAQYAAFHPEVGVPQAPQGGLAGLTSSIQNFVDLARASGRSPAEIRAEAYRAMLSEGYTFDDVQRATGMSVEELFPDVQKAPPKPVAVGPQPVMPPAPQPGPTYDVTPAPLYQPSLPFTQPGGGTVYPNTLPTATGEQPTYFPTAWWTSSPSASSAYGLKLPSTARDFNAEMAAYRQRYAPQYYLPRAPRDPLRTVDTPPPIAPRAGYTWQWDATQGKWVEQPATAANAAAPAPTPASGDLGYAAGGAVNELWDKYHG